MPSMFEIFSRYLTSHVDLTPEELDQVEARSIRKLLRRKQFLSQEGNVFQYKCFVTKGLLKSYRVREEGTEHILRFAPENYWIADMESFREGLPSKYNIDAIEDSEVLMWSRTDFEELLGKIPAYKEFTQRIMSKSFDASQNRIFSNISFTAEEKYNSFITDFPDLYPRIPLHMIASYLGISRETLSRVRNAKMPGSRQPAAGSKNR